MATVDNVEILRKPQPSKILHVIGRRALLYGRARKVLSPASRSRTLMCRRADNFDARTHPAVPPPTIMISKQERSSNLGNCSAPTAPAGMVQITQVSNARCQYCLQGLNKETSTHLTVLKVFELVAMPPPSRSPHDLLVFIHYLSIEHRCNAVGADHTQKS